MLHRRSQPLRRGDAGHVAAGPVRVRVVSAESHRPLQHPAHTIALDRRFVPLSPTHTPAELTYFAADRYAWTHPLRPYPGPPTLLPSPTAQPCGGSAAFERRVGGDGAPGPGSQRASQRAGALITRLPLPLSCTPSLSLSIISRHTHIPTQTPPPGPHPHPHPHPTEDVDRLDTLNDVSTSIGTTVDILNGEPLSSHYLDPI